MLKLLLTVFLLQNGVRALEGEGIISGEKSNPNELGYQVSLQVIGIHICGGAIIDDSHIITAAHCVIDNHLDFTLMPLKVVAGTINVNFADGYYYAVDRFYVPTMFNISEIKPTHDIVVIKLKSKLNLNDSGLRALSLPSSSAVIGDTYADEEALVSGFGWNEIKITKVPVPEEKRIKDGNEFELKEVGDSDGYLLKAKALILDNRECKTFYRSIIHENQICARLVQHHANVKQGFCVGDSGGPLVHNGKTLIGVVSWNSIGCDDSVRPGVYTRVSEFLDFINNARQNKVTDDMRVYVSNAE